MALLQFLTGAPGKFEQISKLTPQQQQLQNAALQQFAPLLQQLQQPVNIQPILEQRRKSFETQTIPSLAERFTGMGGGQRSSGFQGALGTAGSSLESDLAALQSQTALQDLSRQQGLLGLLSNLGMQPSFENVYQQGSQGLLGSAASSIGAGLGSYLGSGGSPLSGLMGGLSNLFGARRATRPQLGATPSVTPEQYNNLLQLLYTLAGQQAQSSGSIPYNQQQLV